MHVTLKAGVNFVIIQTLSFAEDFRKHCFWSWCWVGDSHILHVISSHENNSDCNTHEAFYFISSFFSSAIFLGIVVLNDRFLAIHLRLRYQDLNSFLNSVIYCRKMRHHAHDIPWRHDHTEEHVFAQKSRVLCHEVQCRRCWQLPFKYNESRQFILELQSHLNRVKQCL